MFKHVSLGSELRYCFFNCACLIESVLMEKDIEVHSKIMQRLPNLSEHEIHTGCPERFLSGNIFETEDVLRSFREHLLC